MNWPALTLDVGLAVRARFPAESAPPRRGRSIAGDAVATASLSSDDRPAVHSKPQRRRARETDPEPAVQAASAGTHAAADRSSHRNPPGSITLDYLDLYGLKPSVERVKDRHRGRVASPRVLKPGEERIVDFLLSCDCSHSGALCGPAERTARSRTRESPATSVSTPRTSSPATELLDVGLRVSRPPTT